MDIDTNYVKKRKLDNNLDKINENDWNFDMDFDDEYESDTMVKTPKSRIKRKYNNNNNIDKSDDDYYSSGDDVDDESSTNDKNNNKNNKKDKLMECICGLKFEYAALSKHLRSKSNDPTHKQNHFMCPVLNCGRIVYDKRCMLYLCNFILILWCILY